MIPQLKLSLLLAITCLLTGCHVLKTPEWKLEEAVDDSPLATPKLANDSVVIEVAFIRVPADNKQQMMLVWNDIDETHISTKLRTKLRENGIRCGKLPNAIPTSFETLLSGDKNITDPNAQSGSLNLNLGLRNRRLQCSAGSENHVVLSDSVIDNLVIIHSEEEYTTAENSSRLNVNSSFERIHREMELCVWKWYHKFITERLNLSSKDTKEPGYLRLNVIYRNIPTY